MSYENTKYRDLSLVCEQAYGIEQGKKIYQEAEANFLKMQQETDYRGSSVIKEHMDNNIFPVLAYYMALLSNGFSQEAAYELVLQQTQKHARIQEKKNQKLGKLPFAFPLFRIGVKQVMAKSFPNEGWETEWVCSNSQEVHFNLKRCVYSEVVSAYGHPELCTVFCKNDTTSFRGYLPKIVFQRSGTIGEGKQMCDFHYIKGK